MKIVHISLSGPYTEGWSYHENLLPYWHMSLGNQVTLIARNSKYNEKGEIVPCEPEKKMQDNGILLYRLRIKNRKINSWIKPKRSQLIKILIEEKPDYIWIHGVMNHFLKYVVEYKKKYNSDVIISADNHTDFYNYKNDLLRRINLVFLRLRLKSIKKYINMFYGVTPGRCDFLHDQLGIENDKIKLSLQGGNPDEIDYESKETINKNIRKKYGIPENSFIYVTGGKLDNKKKIIELIKSFSFSSSKNIRLLIFGSISKEILKDFKEMCSMDDRIIYIGWLNTSDTNNVFLSSNLGIFPGGHSVLWEQALSCGLPCAFERRKGFEHVFSGGSECLQYSVDNQIQFDFDNFPLSDDYFKIMQKAQTTRTKFLYSDIARETIKDFAETH